MVSQESAEFWGMGERLACGMSFYDCAVDHLASDPPQKDPGRCCAECAHEDWERGGISRGNTARYERSGATYDKSE
jgi:hypothetical protein